MLTCPHCGHAWRPTHDALTPRQAGMLRFLETRIRADGVAPSLAEIAVEFRLASQATVHEHLSKLESKGVIARGAGPRNITLLVRSDELGHASEAEMDDDEEPG